MFKKSLILVPLFLFTVEASSTDLSLASIANQAEIGISLDYGWEAKDGDNLSNSVGLGLNLATKVSDSWSIIARYKYWQGVKIDTSETDISRYLLGLRYDLLSDKSSTPYLLGAVGYEEYSNTVADRDGGILNVGLGYRMLLSDKSSLFIEGTYRTNYTTDIAGENRENGAIISLGANFHF